jgi:hypothetical protein
MGEALFSILKHQKWLGWMIQPCQIASGKRTVCELENHNL